MKTPLPKIPDLRPRPGKTMLVVDAEGRAPIPEACAFFDIEQKKLVGILLRNGQRDVLGNVAEGTVYAWSLERYLNRVLRLGKEGKHE